MYVNTDMKLNRRRRGKFIIDNDLIFLSPEIVQLIMSRCIVVRAEHMIINDTTKYHAYSPEFDVIPFGTFCPSYDIEINCDEAGSHSIMFKRRD